MIRGKASHPIEISLVEIQKFYFTGFIRSDCQPGFSTESRYGPVGSLVGPALPLYPPWGTTDLAWGIDSDPI